MYVPWHLKIYQQLWFQQLILFAFIFWQNIFNFVSLIWNLKNCCYTEAQNVWGGQLPGQGPIPEIFTKKYWELTVWKSQFFFSWPFWVFFFQKKFFFALSSWKSGQKLWGRMNVTQFLWLLWFIAKKVRNTNIFGHSICTIGSTFLSSDDGKIQ